MSSESWLQEIEHIVVLMMENRSFDHMLGYLALEGADKPGAPLDGLESDMSNPGLDEAPMLVHPLASTQLHGPGPGHDADDVADQLAHQNNGFVKNYIVKCLEAGNGDHGLPMGYFDHESLPVYDFLARNFCVCDRWHCSVPGPTWPNRIYALTGGPDLSQRDPLQNRKVPIYRCESFVRELDRADVSWRWYSHLDPAPPTLALADKHYRGRWLLHDHRFRYVGRGTSWRGSFVEDAAAGDLPAVSWIDPRLVIISQLHSDTNDDHHPSDVRHGQELVRDILGAITEGDRWSKTLLLITYDEHGGFFDHCVPHSRSTDPAWPGEPAIWGPRVPAIAVSPWLQPGSVCSTPFEHTTIIRTIFERFCPEAHLTPRAQGAASLADLFSLPQAREMPLMPTTGSPRAGLTRFNELGDDDRALTDGAVAAFLRGIPAAAALALPMEADGEPPAQPEAVRQLLDLFEAPNGLDELQAGLVAAAHEVVRAGTVGLETAT